MGVLKPTILEARAKYKEHEIVFTNSWSLFPYKSKATLEVDKIEIAATDKMSHMNPNIPLFSLDNISPEIHSIKVFIIGVFRVKASISINGEIVYHDNIDELDKMQARVFET